MTTEPKVVGSEDSIRVIADDFQTTLRYQELKPKTNLGFAPPNWLQVEPFFFEPLNPFGYVPSLSPGWSQLWLHGAELSDQAAVNLLDHAFNNDNSGKGPDFIGSAACMKELFSLPYSSRAVSIVIHRVGETLYMRTFGSEEVDSDQESVLSRESGDDLSENDGQSEKENFSKTLPIEQQQQPPELSAALSEMKNGLSINNTQSPTNRSQCNQSKRESSSCMQVNQQAKTFSSNVASSAIDPVKAKLDSCETSKHLPATESTQFSYADVVATSTKPSSPNLVNETHNTEPSTTTKSKNESPEQLPEAIVKPVQVVKSPATGMKKKKNKEKARRRDLLSKLYYFTVLESETRKPSGDGKQRHEQEGQLDYSSSPDTSRPAKESEKKDDPQKRHHPHCRTTELSVVSFRKTLWWRFGSQKLVVGSNLVLFHDDDNMPVSLRLVDVGKPVSASRCLDYYLDNRINNVPALALCLHEGGSVLGYRRYRTEEIPGIIGELSPNSSPKSSKAGGGNSNQALAFSPSQVEQHAAQILKYLQRKCKSGESYWLFKANQDSFVHLCHLSPTMSRTSKGRNRWMYSMAMLCYRVAHHAVPLRGANMDPPAGHESDDDGSRELLGRYKRQQELLIKCISLLEDIATNGPKRYLLRASIHEQLANSFASSSFARKTYLQRKARAAKLRKDLGENIKTARNDCGSDSGSDSGSHAESDSDEPTQHRFGEQHTATPTKSSPIALLREALFQWKCVAKCLADNSHAGKSEQADIGRMDGATELVNQTLTRLHRNVLECFLEISYLHMENSDLDLSLESVQSAFFGGDFVRFIPKWGTNHGRAELAHAFEVLGDLMLAHDRHGARKIDVTTTEHLAKVVLEVMDGVAMGGTRLQVRTIREAVESLVPTRDRAMERSQKIQCDSSTNAETSAESHGADDEILAESHGADDETSSAESHGVDDETSAESHNIFEQRQARQCFALILYDAALRALSVRESDWWELQTLCDAWNGIVDVGATAQDENLAANYHIHPDVASNQLCRRLVFKFGNGWNELGKLRLGRGQSQFERARDAFVTGIQSFKAAGDVGNSMLLYCNLSHLYRSIGISCKDQTDEGLAHLRKSLEILVQANDLLQAHSTEAENNSTEFPNRLQRRMVAKDIATWRSTLRIETGMTHLILGTKLKQAASNAAAAAQGATSSMVKELALESLTHLRASLGIHEKLNQASKLAASHFHLASLLAFVARNPLAVSVAESLPMSAKGRRSGVQLTEDLAKRHYQHSLKGFSIDSHEYKMCKQEYHSFLTSKHM